MCRKGEKMNKYKEAIEAIKANYPPENYSLLREALDLAIKVLEKNTPKKPILLTHLPLIQSGWKYGCPSCKLAVGVNSYSFDYTDEDEYCPSCGQKLNWD